MNVGDILELIVETREFLIEDCEYVLDVKKPSNKDLLNHVKESFKEGNLDEMLEEVLLEYDLNDMDDDYKLLLLNRWSQLIFESNSIEDTWNGKYKDVDVPEGVYFYRLRYSGYDLRTVYERLGTITVIR
jgi:gliding motility-associated-like protein